MAGRIIQEKKMNIQNEKGVKLPQTSVIDTGTGADTNQTSQIDNVPPGVNVNQPGKIPVKGTTDTPSTSYQDHGDGYTDFSEK
jgi:hypothetical protein